MLVDTPADVERHWSVSREGRRRISSKCSCFGNRGLDPALVPLIVARAHAAGLHVSAHVSSAADFRIAVDGGVDQIAHVPGQRSNDPSRYLLTMRMVRTLPLTTCR
jgi:hypothetical protein